MRTPQRRLRSIIAVVSLVLIGICAKLPVAQSQSNGSSWPLAGQNLHNTRNQSQETKISRQNVSQLQIKWQKSINANIHATPAVEGGFLYIPDSKGNLYKLDAKTGDTVWQKKISNYTGIEGDISRTTPVVTENSLIFGKQSPRESMGAWMLSVGKKTGRLNWYQQVDETAGAHITQSAVVHEGKVYVGVSSSQEGLAANVLDYKCCDFRGKVVALDENTGELMLHQYMPPPAPETSSGAAPKKQVEGLAPEALLDRFSGAAVWGSTPVVNAVHNLLYIPTGNNYTVPYAVQACVDRCGSEPPSPCLRKCLEPHKTNYFDSLVALRLGTFEVAWSYSAVPYDAWTVACQPGSKNPKNCPVPSGDDYDFGQGAMLFPGGGDTAAPLFVGAGAKSGVFWAWEAASGQLQWHTQVGPGGTLGGSEWGSATDGQRIYVAISNSERKKWTLQGKGDAAGLIVNKGFWSALDPATGRILWQTPEPIDPPAGATGLGPQGPVTVATGVVYGCSTTFGGEDMFALDAETGVILWRFNSGGSCNAGAAVVDGVVYWGSRSPTHPRSYLTEVPADDVTATLFAFEPPLEN